tara:strand:- start:278 stop:1270 length:993 start_codon:yes stop_codon:yes gene_type:complete
MMTKEDLVTASDRVSSFFPSTPILLDYHLTKRLGRPTYLKLENLQATGSFKVRGALNCMANLTPELLSRGVVTCSSGNHGRAVATVANMLGVAATVCVPVWVDSLKLSAMKEKGAEIIVEGKTYDEAERISLELATERGLTYVHPFDDIEVIAGQGTVALEILSQLSQVGDVVVPLSGGGLAGGIGFAMRAHSPETKVIAVSAEKAAVMLASITKGRPTQLKEQPTIASALSGGIDLENRHTFKLIQEKIDQHLTVNEDMIKGAMRYALNDLHMVVEGGGAVGLAALLSRSLKISDSSLPIVVVISGGNVASDQLAELYSPYKPDKGIKA